MASERDPGTKTTVPFHIWKHNVQIAAIAQGAPGELVMQLGDEITACGQPRLALWYNTGEPIWMAAQSLAFLAKGHALHARAESDLNFRRMLGRKKF
jgi:hypothetical protein